MEQVQNPMYKLIQAAPKALEDYISLAKIEPLRYPSLVEQLQKAHRLFSMFTDEVVHTKEVVKQYGQEYPEALAHAVTATKRLRGLAAILDRIGANYQSKLNEKVAEYSRQMDEQYEAFYRHMADNLFANIKEKNVDVPKVPIAGNEVSWSKLFVEGTVPLDGFETCRKIMDEYDRLLNEADKLYEATKDTSLNTRALYALLMQHQVMFKDKEGKLHIGGKRGKINIDFQTMKMAADKEGSFHQVHLAPTTPR